MIQRLWLANFGPFASASIELAPFTVFLGRNGSGKSLLFWAIRTLGRVARFSLREGGFPTRTGQVAFSDIVHRKDPNLTIKLGAELQTTEGHVRYEVHLARRPMGTALVEEHLLWTPTEGEPVKIDATPQGVETSISNKKFAVPRVNSAPYILFRNPETSSIGEAIQAALWNRTSVYRFDPSALKTPAEVGRTLSITGYGFAAYLDFIRNEAGGQAAFEALVDSVRPICPHLKDVLLPVEPAVETEKASRKGHAATSAGTEKASRKRLALIMSDPAETIPVELESDGTILLLAYAALLHGSKDLDTVCIEEPENGIHPRAIPEQVKMLRRLSEPATGRSGIQVLVATHSRPFYDQIVNENQLRLVRRSADGRSVVETPPAVSRPALAGWAGLEPA